MIWLLYFIASFVIMVICYLTNPIVCLFSDEEGELHGFLNYWQTWDDSLNPRFFVMEKVPSFLRYDYDRHYEEYEGTTPELERVGRTRWFCRVKDPNFTFWEKIQRYCCQVLWLTRNCSYGFSFWLLGREVDPKDITWPTADEHTRHGYEKDKSILTRTWTFQCDAHWFWKIRWEIYLGWKVGYELDHLSQCMIANRIAIRFED